MAEQGSPSMAMDQSQGKLSASDRQLIERLKQTYPPEVLAELFAESMFSPSRKASGSQRSSRISRARSSTRTSLSSSGWSHMHSDRPFSLTTTISSQSSYGEEEDCAARQKDFDEKTLEAMVTGPTSPNTQELPASPAFTDIPAEASTSQECIITIPPATYLCTWCGDLFNEAEDWKHHERNTHELRFFWPCPVNSCAEVFINANEFDKHHRSAHATMNRMSASSVIRPLPPKQTWGCGFSNCCKVFYNWEERCVHVAHHFESFARDTTAPNEGRHWSYSTMMRNLLRQPSTSDSFTKLMSLIHGPIEESWPRLKWRLGNTGELRRQLEYCDFPSGVQAVVQLAHETGRPNNVATFTAMSARKMAALPSPPLSASLERRRQTPDAGFAPMQPQFDIPSPPLPGNPASRKLALSISPPSPAVFTNDLLTPPYYPVVPGSPRHSYSRSDTATLKVITAAPSSTNGLRPPPSPLSPLSPTGFEFANLIDKFPTPPVPVSPPLPELSRPSRSRAGSETQRPRTAGSLLSSSSKITQIMPFPSHIFGSQPNRPSTAKASDDATRPSTSTSESKSRPSTPISPKALVNRARNFITRERSTSAATLDTISDAKRSSAGSSSVANSSSTSPALKTKRSVKSRPPVLRLAPRCDPPAERVVPVAQSVLANTSMPRKKSFSLSRSTSISSLAPLARPSIISSGSAPAVPSLRSATSMFDLSAKAAEPTSATISPPRQRYKPIFVEDPYGASQVATPKMTEVPAEYTDDAPASPPRVRHQPITIPYVPSVPSRESSLKMQSRPEPGWSHRVAKARTARFNSDVGVDNSSTNSFDGGIRSRRKLSASSVLSPNSSTYRDLTGSPLSPIQASPMLGSFPVSYETTAQSDMGLGLDTDTFVWPTPASSNTASAPLCMFEKDDGINALLDSDPISRAIRKKARESGQFMTLAQFLNEVPPPA